MRAAIESSDSFPSARAPLHGPWGRRFCWPAPARSPDLKLQGVPACPRSGTGVHKCWLKPGSWECYLGESGESLQSFLVHPRSPSDSTVRSRLTGARSTGIFGCGDPQLVAVATPSTLLRELAPPPLESLMAALVQ